MEYSESVLRPYSMYSAGVDDLMPQHINLDFLTTRKFFCELDEHNCDEMALILIVDDNMFNIVTLQTMLELQFKVKSEKATNGHEAVRKVMERKALCACGEPRPVYNLIFMDCNMPIMDGFEATEEIRKLDFIN